MQPWFDDMFDPLITKLRQSASMQRVKKGPSAIEYLVRRPPSAVLITDEALTEPEYQPVWDAVLNYVRQGGTAVVMGQFSSFVQRDNIEPFFGRAGLPWACGNYVRTTTVLNQNAVGHDLIPKLPSEYSQKAVFLQNVAPQDKWYLPGDDSVVESQVFLPEEIQHRQAAAALALVGTGKLGYIGDVNEEEGSDTVILAMCGMLG